MRCESNFIAPLDPQFGGLPSTAYRDKDNREELTPWPWPLRRDHRSGFQGGHLERELKNLTAENCFACDACTQTAEARHKHRGCTVM